MRRFLTLCLLAIAIPSAAQQPRPAADLLAAPGQPGWSLDPRTRCRLWNPAPRAEQSVQWQGPCRGGFAEGRGVAVWTWRDFEGTARTARYEGTYRAGQMEGRGTFTDAGGNTYEGEYLNDVPHGFGRLSNIFGEYVGEWQAGERHGQGLQTWNSGDRYNGEWREDEMNGRGFYTWADGSRYIGRFREGLPHGVGQAVIGEASTVFRGTFVNGCLPEAPVGSFVGYPPLAECP